MTAADVLRHAQSTWNVSRRWQGQADPPLSALGEWQARQAGPILPRFGLVVTSDLRRARRTGELIAAAQGGVAALEAERGLREFDVGRWSGLTRDEIAARWPEELARFDGGELDAAPGGESREEFDKRVAGALRSVAAAGEAASRRDESVLVITHGGVIRSILRQSGLEDRQPGHLMGLRGDLGGGTFTPSGECSGREEGHWAGIPSGP